MVFVVEQQVVMTKREYPTQKVLCVSFEDFKLANWSTALALLKERLIPKLSLRDNRAGLVLDVSTLDNQADIAVGIGNWQPHGLAVRLTPVELDAVVILFFEMLSGQTWTRSTP